MHLDLPGAERRDQADLLWPERGAPRNDDGAASHVLPAQSDIRAFGDGTDAHAGAVARDDLLRIDGVGAARHRRAGHDAQRLAALERSVEDGPRRQVGDDVERGFARGRDVCTRDGIAIDRGIVGRRDVQRRRDVGGEHAPERARERLKLRGQRRRDLGEDAVLAVPHRDHDDIVQP
jgi:hypothetical protein